jgi:hypothetical protein
MFHGANPGHIWRGELGSMLGEAVLSSGVVMWLAYLTYSPRVVALALIALALPALLSGPLGATLTRVEEPAGMFRLVGRLRFVFALLLIGMHFLTVLPLLYLLLFAISLCSRLRAKLRIAAMRACLAPGEPDRVAASTHFAAVIVAVVGPLLSTTLFILNGERILAVAIGAAFIFLIGTSADALLHPLPRQHRAFLLAKPPAKPRESADLDDEELATAEAAYDDEEEDGDDPEAEAERREAALPEWQQWGPGTIRQAVADVFGGLRLIGSRGTSTTGLRALVVLAIVGGGLGVFEVFYITDQLYLPTFFLGVLLAAQGAGMAIGATLWSDLGRKGAGRGATFVGTLLTGIALLELASVTQGSLAIGCAVALGLGNALAVEGARQALRAGFDGVERRAIAAAESAIVAVCGIAGAGIYVVFHHGYTLGQGSSQRVIFAPLTTVQLIWLSGLALVVAGIALIVLLVAGGVMDRRRERRELAALENDSSLHRGRVPGGLSSLSDTDDDGGWDDEPQDNWDDEPDDYDNSRYAPRVKASRRGGRGRERDWGDDEDEDNGGWRRGRRR